MVLQRKIPNARHRRGALQRDQQVVVEDLRARMSANSSCR
jgi:hypothetical protein